MRNPRAPMALALAVTLVLVSFVERAHGAEDIVPQSVACAGGFLLRSADGMWTYEPLALHSVAAEGYATNFTLFGAPAHVALNLCGRAAQCASSSNTNSAVCLSSVGSLGSVVSGSVHVATPSSVGVDFIYANGDVCEPSSGTRFSTRIAARCATLGDAPRLVFDSLSGCQYAFTLYTSAACAAPTTTANVEFGACPSAVVTPDGYVYDTGALSRDDTSPYMLAASLVPGAGGEVTLPGAWVNVCGQVSCLYAICGVDGLDCLGDNATRSDVMTSAGCEFYMDPATGRPNYRSTGRVDLSFVSSMLPTSAGVVVQYRGGDWCAADPTVRLSTVIYARCDESATTARLSARRAPTGCVREYVLESAAACAAPLPEPPHVGCDAPDGLVLAETSAGFRFHSLGADVPGGLAVSVEAESSSRYQFGVCAPVACVNAVNGEPARDATDPVTACREYLSHGLPTREVVGRRSTTVVSSLLGVDEMAGYTIRTMATSRALNPSVTLNVRCARGVATTIAFASVSAAAEISFDVKGDTGACLVEFPKTYIYSSPALPKEQVALISAAAAFVALVIGTGAAMSVMHMYKRSRPNSCVPDPAMWLVNGPCATLSRSTAGLYEPVTRASAPPKRPPLAHSLPGSADSSADGGLELEPARTRAPARSASSVDV